MTAHKSIPVEERTGDFYCALADQPHLNPIRAGLAQAHDLLTYPWSNLANGFAALPKMRPACLAVAAGLAALGESDTTAGAPGPKTPQPAWDENFSADLRLHAAGFCLNSAASALSLGPDASSAQAQTLANPNTAKPSQSKHLTPAALAKSSLPRNLRHLQTFAPPRLCVRPSARAQQSTAAHAE